MRERLVEASLARHRNDRPPAVELNLPLFPNLDVARCNVVSSDLAKVGHKWEHQRAVKELWRTLPSTSGLYMFVFRSPLTLSAVAGSHQPSWVLYVGRAGSETAAYSIKERYRQNYAKYVEGDPELLWSTDQIANRDQKLARYLTIYPLEFWWLEVPDLAKIKPLEDHLIKMLDPLLNKTQKLNLRPSAPEPAFKGR